MVPYLSLIGMLFNKPVYYIHEAFGDIIEMPPAPISWDYTLLADYEEFFEWVDADLRPLKEVDTRLRSLPSEIRLLLAEEDGYTFLSPAGEAFYEAYRQKEISYAKVPVFLSDKAQSAYETSEPSIQNLFRRTFSKLRISELRRSGSDRVILTAWFSRKVTGMNGFFILKIGIAL